MFNNPYPKLIQEVVNPYLYPIINTEYLPKPEFSPIDFWTVLGNRRSTRSFSKLTLLDISTILWGSAKVKLISLQENSYVLTQRPYASAGARHPVDILVLSPTLKSSSAFHYYNPFEHTLNELRLDDSLIHSFKEHINSILNVQEGTIFWFLAHLERTAAKYNNPFSLIWRDAGTLLQTIQLTCTALSLNSCPIGSLGGPFMSKLLSSDNSIFGTGGIVIGR